MSADTDADDADDAHADRPPEADPSRAPLPGLATAAAVALEGREADLRDMATDPDTPALQRANLDRAADARQRTRRALTAALRDAVPRRTYPTDDDTAAALAADADPDTLASALSYRLDGDDGERIAEALRERRAWAEGVTVAGLDVRDRGECADVADRLTAGDRADTGGA